MAGIYVNDAGTLRRIRSAYVNDNGTLRRIRAAYSNDNGTLRRHPLLLAFTFTAGTGDLQGSATPVAGYGDDAVPLLDGGAMGSITAGSITNHDGKFVSAFFTETGPNTTRLYIDGFSSDPGAGYLDSLVINGVSVSLGSISYTWGAGVTAGIWSFTLPATIEAGNEFVNGNSYSVEIEAA